MDVVQAPADAGMAADGRDDDGSLATGSARSPESGVRALWAGAARATQRLGAALCSTEQRALRTSLYATIATTCAVATVMLWTGPNPLRATGHDLLLPLDAAWRITHGQVPHNDFYSPLGPVFSYWAALWMVLLGPVASLVHYSIIGYGLGLAAAAFVVARDRLSALSSWAFSSAVLLTAVAPYPVGWPPEALDTAMAYNRLAFGIVAILAVEAALPSVRSGARPTRDALLAGALLGLLPLLKLNFAVIGLGTQALVLLYPGQPLRPYRRMLWVALGVAIPALLFFVVIGVDWHSFLADMRMVRHVFDDSRPNTAEAVAALVRKLRPAIIESLYPTLIGAFLVVAAASLRNLLRGFGLCVVYAYLLAADLAMGISNTQLPSLTLLPFVPLFALETLRRGAWLEPEATRPSWPVRHWLASGVARSVLTLSATLSLLIGVGAGPLRGLRESITYAVHPAEQHALTGHGFESVVPYPVSDQYPVAEAHGLALLRQYLEPGQKLVTLDFSNPFNMALSLAPPRGDALWWHEGKTFSAKTHLPPERVFAEGDWVIVAKRWEHQVMPVYGGYLAEHYDELSSNSYWSLYRRRVSPPT